MKKHLKLSLFFLSLALVVSGCAQKIKPEEKNNTQLPEKIVSATTQEVKKPDFWGKDVVVDFVGQSEIITNKKHGFSVSFPVDYKIDEVNANPEFLNIGDVAVYVATGTVENLNRDFLKMTGPIANLKIAKIKISNGKIGYIQSYEGEGIKNYKFLISLGDKKNVLFIEKAYEGEAISSSSSVFNSIVLTVGIATTSDAFSSDIIVSENGGEKIITHNKYKFSLKVSSNSTVTKDYLPADEVQEAFRVGDVGVFIATGTIESLDKGFFEEDGPIAGSDVLKSEKIVVASGQVGQAYFYDYNTSNYSAHSYSFLIPVNEGKNILILKMGNNGNSSRKDFFKNVISTVSIN